MSREIAGPRSPGWPGNSAIPTPRVVYGRAKEGYAPRFSSFYKIEVKTKRFLIPHPLKIFFGDHYHTQTCEKSIMKIPLIGWICDGSRPGSWEPPAFDPHLPLTSRSYCRVFAIWRCLSNRSTVTLSWSVRRGAVKIFNWNGISWGFFPRAARIGEFRQGFISVAYWNRFFIYIDEQKGTAIL